MGSGCIVASKVAWDSVSVSFSMSLGSVGCGN